ncbi:MAG: SDR family oxidoreductase [Leptolyngbya sp. SIO4C1]|nr:SDR family oxidoreductase [Leptolyngbya sp. SIO4C1]
MAQTVLITGASSGIGYEFANIFAAQGYSLVLVARSEGELRELSQRLSQQAVEVTVLPFDLSQPEAPQQLFEQTKAQGLQIDILINNAGIGDYGPFIESDWPKQNTMLQLNMAALTHLCHLFLPEMVARRSGKVLNVSSLAAFQPGPFMAVYYATKAYVLSFTEAINSELKGSGVMATALCPGPTQSKFQARANLTEIDFFQSNQLPTAAEVAQFGYEALMRQDTVAVHGWTNKLLATLPRLLPRQVITSAVRRMQAPSQA